MIDVDADDIFGGLDDAAVTRMNVPSCNKKAIRNTYKRKKTITNPLKKKVCHFFVLIKHYLTIDNI